MRYGDTATSSLASITPTHIDLRLLCFGASITAGWSANGTHLYPYSTRLSARLADELQTSHFSIDVDGSSGDTAINGQYLHRMRQDMKDEKIQYDWVIVQGGGNDLGWDRTPEEIFEALRVVWGIPLKAGAKVLALTVTEHGNDNAQQNEKREILNALVSSYHADGFYTADLATAIPYKSMPVEKRKKIWSDDTHFTKEGYELMGDAIADRLVEIIGKSESLWSKAEL